MSSSSLVAPFLEAAPVEVRGTLGSIAALEARLAALVAEGRAAWPALAVDPRVFVELIGRHVTAELADAALDGLRPADLYLACACAHHAPGSIETFDRDYIREVDIALSRMRLSAAKVADVKQLVRQRLFVGGGTSGAPTSAGKISEYAGRGDLRRWIRSVAVRTCLNEMRKGKREVLVDDDHLIAQHAVATADDPEVQYMKQMYSDQFKGAFAVALGQLGAREQTLLRYHHVDGLNIDEIGAIYRVHRVTAFRWLEKAKEQVVRVTLETLRAKLKLPAAELDSVLRMIRSQIHLSLVRQLGGPSDRVADDVDAAEAGDAVELDGSELQELDELEPT